jgi:dihydroorotase
MGHQARLEQLIEPHWTIVGAEAIKASRYVPHQKSALNAAAGCPHCGWVGSR